MSPPSPPPGLQEATNRSTEVWQANLQSLFVLAKDRFPDVVWDLVAEESEDAQAEEVWGHKAIVYARAPPSFQARYFPSFRPAPATSPSPYSHSPQPAQSALSLSLGLDIPGISRSPSPFRVASPSPSSAPGTLLRLNISIGPALFSNELEYLYTGKGLGEAFEFFFGNPESRTEGETDEERIDKLRKDLVFMWRSRLYSDIRIALTGSFSSGNHEDSTAIFSSHRFMLVSRSPYFHDALLSWGRVPKPEEPLTLTLPSPPFTPASLHFTLGFIYTGTLIFSHRTYDLDTAFHIMRSATYLSLDTLFDEIQARIVQEMCHGLFHAFLEFPEYERITGGKWGTGGCRCRQCARRAPRVLEFALSDDVKNINLERGARRALVGLFGEGWCTSEFAALPQKIKDSVLKGLGKRTTPINIFALLFAAQHAIAKLTAIIDAWADASREMILAARKTIDDILCNKSEECFEQSDWLELMDADGDRFEDGEKVDHVMQAIRRGLTEKNAGMVYQTLVSSILLRPHATDADATLLSPTSHIRVQVEETRLDVLKWLLKRWMNVRQEGGFDALEPWARTEISHEINVADEDLLSLAPPRSSTAKSGLKPKADRESDAVSLHSIRVSVTSRKPSNLNGSATRRETLLSSAASVRSVARSTLSTTSKATTSTPVRRADVPPGPRPDSKLTPSSPTHLTSPSTSDLLPSPSDTPQSPPKPSASTLPSRRGAAPRNPPLGNGPSRAKSLAPSVSSVRSHPSTLRKAPATATSSRSPSTVSRPTSSVSNTSDGATTFRTANSELLSDSATDSRRASAVSTVSTVSTVSAVSAVSTLSTVSKASTETGPSTKPERPRKSSTASVASTVSKVRRPAVPTADPSRLSVAVPKRSPSAASVRSSASTSSAAPPKKILVRKVPAAEKKVLVESKVNGHAPSASASSANTIKGKGRASTLATAENRSSAASSSSVSTVNGALKRKGSADTITKQNMVHDKPHLSPLKKTTALTPRGATLDIGIPCIISSKRKRFKAYCRYIGEVEGELGPWVGVEVPVGENWAGDKLEGRQWNDGSWGGIRYFEIGGAGSEWDYGDDRASRRRRVDMVNSLVREKGLKREGDQLSVDRAKRMRSGSPAMSDASNSETRGLFVRPQQVLYVMDAVDSDI